MSGFKLQRLGMIMEPEPGNAHEVEGVLNPGVVRGPDGALYLFPRLVAKDNYSRIGIARVRFNKEGDPTGVERLGIALEPEAEYERRSDGGGGCEDPRVTFVGPLQRGGEYAGGFNLFILFKVFVVIGVKLRRLGIRSAVAHRVHPEHFLDRKSTRLN